MNRARIAALAERWVPLLTAVAIVWPLAAYSHAAAFDLGFHEEIVGALRYHGDPSHYPPGFLVWNLGMPNQLFYFLAYPLTFFVSVHAACTIILAASVAWIPLAAARLAAKLGRTRWVALAVAPVAIGFPFNRGFAPNVLGIALLLAVLPWFDRFAARPTAARAAWVVATLLLLDLAHESAMACGALAIAVLSLGHPLRVRETVLRALPPATALAFVFAVHARARPMHGLVLRGLPQIIDHPRWQKEDDLPRMIVGLHDPAQVRFVMYALVATLLLLAADSWRTRGRARGPRGRWRYAILAGVLVEAYFRVPWSVEGATFVNQRFLSPAVAIIAVVLAPGARVGPSIPTCLASIAAVGTALAAVLPGFATTSASLGQLDALMPLIAPGSAVGHIEIIAGQSKDFVFSIGGATAHMTAARGGRTPSSFLNDSPIPPMVIAREYRWDDMELHDAAGGLQLRPDYDFRRLRYFVVWALSDDVPDARLAAALGSDARFVARSGGWILYESRHETVSVASRELLAPTGAETIDDRVRALPPTESEGR
jgi:hypothetical protein